MERFPDYFMKNFFLQMVHNFLALLLHEINVLSMLQMVDFFKFLSHCRLFKSIQNSVRITQYRYSPKFSTLAAW